MPKSLNILKGIASVFIGIPTAVAATVAIGTVGVIAKVGSTQFSDWITSATGIKTLRVDAGWAAFSDSLWKTVGATWKKWALYPYIETGKFINKQAGRALYSSGSEISENAALIDNDTLSNPDEKHVSDAVNNEVNNELLALYPQDGINPTDAQSLMDAHHAYHNTNNNTGNAKN